MSDPTGFLYPFLQPENADDAGGRAGVDPAAVLADVEASARRKAADVVALRRAFIEEQEDALLTAAAAMADRFREGGRLLTFGCGGSATDALDLAHDFLRPPEEEPPDSAQPIAGAAEGGPGAGAGRPHRGGGRSLPALALVADQALLTAIANDVGFDNVFVRQLISYGRPGDIAVGISTSGNSRSLVAAFRHARRGGLLTVGILGYDGGEAVRSGAVDHALVVRADYIPRVQEAQATICHALRDLVEVMLE